METEKEKSARELRELGKEPFKNFSGCVIWIIVAVILIAILN